MKRNPALQPLSREHQTALMLVYRLKHGRSSNPRYPWPTLPRAQAQKIAQLWQQELSWHFEAEERFLFEPFLPLLSAPLQAITHRLLADHQALRLQIQTLTELSEADLPQALQALGNVLEAHVHCEEREYFTGLQAEIPPQRLFEAGLQLESFYAQRQPFHCIFTGNLRQPHQ